MPTQIDEDRAPIVGVRTEIGTGDPGLFLRERVGPPSSVHPLPVFCPVLLGPGPRIVGGPKARERTTRKLRTHDLDATSADPDGPSSVAQYLACRRSCRRPTRAIARSRPVRAGRVAGRFQRAIFLTLAYTTPRPAAVSANLSKPERARVRGLLTEGRHDEQIVSIPAGHPLTSSRPTPCGSLYMGSQPCRRDTGSRSGCARSPGRSSNPAYTARSRARP